jgi:hypothetical protein
MGAIPMCPACWAFRVGENAAMAARKPIVGSRNRALG